MLKVGDVHLDHFLEADLTTPINLPRASQPWLSRKTEPMMRCVEFYFIGDRWTWPNQSHLTLQDIPKLGKFIDTGLADNFTYSCDAGIIAHLVWRIAVTIKCLTVHVLLNGFTMDGIVIIYVHGAKLEHLEFNDVLPNTSLTVKDRPF